MARKYTIGFELNSASSGMEFSTVTGSPTVSTTVKRSGSYAGKVAGNANQYFQQTVSGGSVFYIRCYIYIDTLPSTNNTILATGNGATILVWVVLNTDGTLQLVDEDGNIGSPSSALSTGTWYRLELYEDLSGAGSTDIITARVDGSDFATSSTRNISNSSISLFRFGKNLKAEADNGGVLYLDDIAINDGTGSFQNSWPGAGSVIVMRPDSAGDNTTWTPTSGSNYANVNETTPDDATTTVGSNTLNQIDEYNLAASGLTATITLVAVNIRSIEGSSASRLTSRIKASSGGTVEETSSLNPPAGWSTNFGSNLSPEQTLYDLPGASTTAWTVSDLDAAQIGMKLSVVGTSNTLVSNVWLTVEYVPSSLYTKELTETATLTQTVMKITAKAFTEAATISDILERVTTKILAQTVSLAQTIIKILDREFSESATADDTLIKIPGKECEESVSITSGLVKVPKKIFSLSVSMTERFFKFLTRELTETATLTADVDKLRLMIFTLTISLTSSLRRVVVKIFGLSISLTEVFQKFKSLTVIVFDETISLSISLVKITGRILIESLSIFDTLIKNLVQIFKRSLTNLKALRRPRILLAAPRQPIVLAASRPTIVNARKDETMVVHEFEKQTEEQYPKGIDFKTVLQTGESIVVSGTTVTAENIDTGADSTSSMLTGGATISGSQLLTTMAENGGNDLENHKIRYKVKTNLGNIFKDEMICRIRNN